MDSFSELHEKSIQNLNDFLNLEVDLGITFARSAKNYLEAGNSAHYEINKRPWNSFIGIAGSSRHDPDCVP